MHHDELRYLSFNELVKKIAEEKKSAIIRGEDVYDGNDGTEFDPYEDDDADCFCD